MNKIKDLNWPHVLALLLVARGLYDFNGAQAALVGILFAYFGYEKWLKYSEDKHISEKLTQLEASLKEVESVKQEVTELRTHLSGLMIKNAARPQEMKQNLESRRFF